MMKFYLRKIYFLKKIGKIYFRKIGKFILGTHLTNNVEHVTSLPMLSRPTVSNPAPRSVLFWQNV